LKLQLLIQHLFFISPKASKFIYMNATPTKIIISDNKYKIFISKIYRPITAFSAMEIEKF